MSMRITHTMLTRTLLTDLQGVSSRLAQTQAELSSGKELTRPSDDPFRTSRALGFRSELALNEQFQKNVAEAIAWQNATDTALTQIGDMDLRARDLLIQGASDGVGPQARDAIAAEVTELAESMKSQANGMYGERHLFSGSATLTPPYALGASDAYAGNTELMLIEFGPGVQINLNTIGQAAIGGDTGGLLATLRTIAADLQAGNTAALQGADITALDAAIDTLTATRAAVGARTSRLETAQARLRDSELAIGQLLSENEDADMAETLLHFSMQQAVYQSALRSVADHPTLSDGLFAVAASQIDITKEDTHDANRQQPVRSDGDRRRRDPLVPGRAHRASGRAVRPSGAIRGIAVLVASLRRPS